MRIFSIPRPQRTQKPRSASRPQRSLKRTTPFILRPEPQFMQ